MKKIIYKIRYFIDVYIIFPIKRWWNYHVKGLYVPNNVRSQALLEYCEKVIKDNKYQPQGAYEHSFEQQLYDSYLKVIENLKAMYPEDDFAWLKYEDERQYCAGRIYELLVQMPWVDE